MENLNAEQVKKALECCTLGDCYPCPYGNIGAGCRDKMSEDALALITSQEQRIGELAEENERLKSEVSVKRKLLDKAEVRIDCLDEVNKVLKADICNATMNLEHITKENDRLKADTVREMQERLTKKVNADIDRCYMLGFGAVGHLSLFIDEINDTAKEMLEGENER